MGFDSAAACLAFIQKNPPLEGLSRPTAPLTTNLNQQQETLNKHYDTRKLQSLYEFQRRVVTGSNKIKTILLFRMIGATFTLTYKFAFLVAVLGYSNKLTALSVVLTFLVLPFFTVDLVTYNELVKPNYFSPLGITALLLIARLHTGFTLLVLPWLRVDPSPYLQILAAVIGVVLLLFDMQAAYLVRWRQIILDIEEPSTKNIHSLIRIGSTVAMVTVVMTLGYQLLRRTSYYYPIEFLLLSLLSPWSILSIPKPSVKNDSNILIGLLIVILVSYWCRRYIYSQAGRFENAFQCRFVNETNDLLLLLNGRTFVDQYAFAATIVSACKNVPHIIPKGLIIIDNEVTLYNKRPLYSSTLFDCYYTPNRSVIQCQEFTEDFNVTSNFQIPKADRRNNLSPTKFVYRIAKLLLSRVLKQLPPIYRSALFTMLCQSMPDLWILQWLVYGLKSDLFLGLFPSDFTKEQLALLGGSCRSEFLSCLGHPSKIISWISSEIILGDRIYPGFLARQASLAKALAQSIKILNMMYIVGPSGLLAPPHPNSKPALFRFSKEIINSVREIVNLMYAPAQSAETDHDYSNRAIYPSSNQAIYPRFIPYIRTDNNVWADYGDGTVGLSTRNRKRLLDLMEISLIFNVDLAWIGLQAIKDLTKARQKLSPSVSASSGSTSTGLTKYFPSLSTNSNASTTNHQTATNDLMKEIYAIYLTKIFEQTEGLSRIPKHPPFVLVPTPVTKILSEFAMCKKSLRVLQTVFRYQDLAFGYRPWARTRQLRPWPRHPMKYFFKSHKIGQSFHQPDFQDD